MKKHFRLLETVPGFILLSFFLGGMLAVLLGGATVYREISRNMEEQFGVATCAGYITAKLRHYDAQGSVFTDEFGDGDCLVLREMVGEEPYVTYLYCSGGNLMELFCREGAALYPEDGEVILPMEQLELETDGSLLLFYCMEKGRTASGAVCLQADAKQDFADSSE